MSAIFSSFFAYDIVAWRGNLSLKDIHIDYLNEHSRLDFEFTNIIFVQMDNSKSN